MLISVCIYDPLIMLHLQAVEDVRAREEEKTGGETPRCMHVSP